MACMVSAWGPLRAYVVRRASHGSHGVPEVRLDRAFLRFDLSGTREPVG